jgi:hypothetical protein
MGDRVLRIRVERLDENAPAAVGQARPHEGLGVRQREEAGLDADPTGDEVLAELDNPGLALVRRH